MNALKSPLMRQLALIISLLIVAIEGVLLVTSVHSKKMELTELRESLNKQVIAETGKSFNELHPGVLDMPDIKKRMVRYKRNIILLTLLITLVVAIGSMVIFYRIAGRHLVKLDSLNSKSTINAKDIPRYPSSELPSNEIGDLIKGREEMLDAIQEYEENLEKKLKEAEDRLIQTAKLSLVGEFTAGIVHDIRNPLTVILNYSKLLQKQEKRLKLGDEKVSAHIEKINLSAQKLNGLVDRMGKFGRSQENYKEDVNLVDIINNSLLFTESKLKKNKVGITKIMPDSAFLYGDEIGLEQVFSNLFSNASDAMEDSESRELLITVNEHEDTFEVEVQDTGKGMNSETLEKAFQSFYTTKKEGKGTGLGLSNVHEIIGRHQGEVMLESTLGRGTRFTLCLLKKKPIMSELPTPAQKSA